MNYVGPRDVLEIDLSTQTTRRFTLEPREIVDVLGGDGLAVFLLERIARERNWSEDLDPFGPENAVVFAAGPFASTPVPAANKHAVATVSPLTQRLNDGLSSSHWSASLRRAGLAALVLTGCADRWVVLHVDGETVRFDDGEPFRGLSARETTKEMRARYSDRTLRVCAIGVAGEARVRFAALENDGRQAGRGGTGAVLGAKRVKAIGLRGRGTVPVADEARALALSEQLRARALGPATFKYRVLGTGANMRVLQRMGQLPSRNFTSAVFEGAENVTPERARESREQYVELRAGCAGCPVQCEHMYVRRFREKRAAAASEYESVWALGPNCGIDDLDTVLDAIERCDRYGLDTISTGGVLAFAMECAQRGLIDEHAFGTPLAFGNAAVVLPAIDAIATRSGLGDLLADGVARAALRIGGSASAIAMHVKGLELPGYEPRALPTYALGLAVSTRGACHNRSATYDRDLRDPSATPTPAERARVAVDAEDTAIAWDSLVLCKFVRECFVDFEREAAELYEAVTGASIDAAAIRASAAKTWARKRALNARLGWTPHEDRLPERLFEPLVGGPLAGRRVDPADLELALIAYSAERDALATSGSGTS